MTSDISTNPFADDKLHEECGIFGIWGKPEAAAFVALGLHALQHRGQEASGIVSYDGDRFYMERREGLVGDQFSVGGPLDKIKGANAIGHVRYSTTGGSLNRNIQPFFADVANGGIALAHNGNLTNAHALRKRLVRNGSIFYSTSDTECIVHLVATSPAGPIVERLIDALKQVEGAYSLVALTRKKLIGVRDPLGVRPLVIGKVDGAYVFASETCALDIIGAEYIRDVKPGELVVISDAGFESFMPFPPQRPRFCIFEYVYFARPDSIIDGQGVYGVRKAIGSELAKESPVVADMVVPVPDSGVPAAIGYAETSGIPFELGIIRNHYVGENLYQVGAYFVQGLIYPVAPLARLVQRVGLDDIQAIYVVGVSAILAWLLLIRRTGQRKTILLALGWFGICLLPGFLFLKFSYVIDGPRLLYQAAVGIALLWVAPLDVLAARLEVGRWRPLLFGLIPLIALASSIWFLQDKAAIYMQSTRLVDQLLMVTPPQAKGPYLLVNFPRWLAPPQSWFTLGHEGIPIVPEYASMYDYYWTVSGRETPIEDVQVDDVKRNWRYSYALVGTPRGTEDMQGRIRKNGRTIFVDLSTRNAIVYDAGRLEAQTTPPATDYIAAYGGALALITGTVQHDAAALQVTLIWQSWRKLPPEQELNTFVHVQKPNGELVAQTDGFPIANLARPSFWLPGDQWRDTRLVPLPDNLPPGEYLVRVGMYPTAGGDRLVALSPQQVRYENDSALVGRMVLP